MSMKRDFVWMFLSKGFFMMAGFLTGSLINRSLGPSGRGILAEMRTWAGLFAVVFGMSINTAIYHFANKKVYGKDDDVRFVTTFLLTLFYGLLAVATFTLLVFKWHHQVSPETLKFVLYLDVFLIFFMLASNLMIFFQALGNIRFSALVGIIQSVVNVGIIGLGYIFGFIDIKFVVLSLIVVEVIALSMILNESIKKFSLSFRHFSKNMAKGMVAAGAKQHLATISTFVYMKVNQLILFRYCGEAQAGIFAVALTLAFGLMIVPMTYQTVLYPRVIHMKDDYEITVRSMRLGFYSWGVVVISVILLAKPILLVYGGDSFLPSVNVFRILMVAVWFLPLSSLLAPYCVKIGAFGIASASSVLLGIISIGLNLFLVPRYASVGAALATSLTCLIGFCMALIFLWYLSRKNPLIIFRPDFGNEVNFIKRLVGKSHRAI